MNMSIISRLLVAAPAVLISITTAPSIHAQGAPVVLLMQSATLPEPGGRAVIVRTQDGAQRNVIVLAAAATAADLAAAMSVLARAIERDNGQLAYPQQRIAITEAAFAAGQSPGSQQYFQAMLERLARAPVLTVPGVAKGRAITVPQNRPNPG
jgi:hypothetical protein